MLQKSSLVLSKRRTMKKIILLAGVLTAAIAFFVANSAQAQKTNQPMKIEIKYQDSYPVYISKDIIRSCDFYVKNLDFEVAFESSFFILLTTKGDPSYRIGFLSEEHPSSPPSTPALKIDAGTYITLQVENAKSVFEQLKKTGLKFSYTLTNEPWGQRRFGLTDPNGMYIDVVEQTEPQEGFWEKYKAKN